MKKIIYLFACTVLIFGSCTDDSTFPNEVNYALENGGFARFVDLNGFTGVVDYGDFTSTYAETRSIEDPNGNLSSVSYDLVANVSGTVMRVENVVSSSSFPFSMQVSQANLASWLGVDPGSLLAGDNFTFEATATRNDGQVFNNDPFIYEAGVEIDSGNGNLIRITESVSNPGTLDTAVVLNAVSVDADKLNGTTYISGNTQSNLEKASYGSAMRFTISIACPFVAEEAVGNYLITNDPFGTSLDYDTPIEAVINSDGTGVIFKNLFMHPEMYDVEFIFSDPALGGVTIARQAAWHCDNFGCSYGEGRVDGSGSYFTCIGLVNVNLQHTVDAGSFGTFNLQLQKQ